MRVFLLMSILILLIPQSQNGQVKTDNLPVEVLSSKWSKTRQKVEKPEEQAVVPAQSALLEQNRNFERNRRAMDSPKTPDPNDQSVEARTAVIDKNEQDARAANSKSIDVFLYQAKVRNAGKNTIEVLFWEYQFKERANPANAVTRQFLCGVNIKPDKEKELKAFSTFSPSNLISVGSLENKSGDLFEEKILINRIEYTDGTIWQRKDWNYINMKPAITRALETPWGLEMCRSIS
jgi:hypothetical protein